LTNTWTSARLREIRFLPAALIIGMALLPFGLAIRRRSAF
jgi:hypothetical protein